ncbi:MAG: sigma-70 family RNA polymerase sigma factor [Tannerella sp.]|jgi:RNA polymerase sigma factor (sigma-70 family)|nr:sigma-70 family RNA polymerase sigma factor [Tannerella sp.]
MQSSPDMDISTDVWEKFCDGDSHAFSVIYRAYTQGMFAYALCLTDNRDLIMDCIHDVFVKVFHIRKELQREKIKFYLIKAMRNELHRAFRDAKENVSVEENESEFATVYSAEDLYIEKEEEEKRRDDVRRMLSILTPNQREAVTYRYMEELSLQEIAEIMGINYHSVQNLLQRSIQKIREKYGTPHINY